jgi:putative membrane protein
VIKSFLRTIVINFASVYLISLLLSGAVTYIGGYQTLLLVALVISLANLFVRPIVNLLLLPIHLLTLGLFRWVANLVVLYLVTWLIPNLQIHAFTYPGIRLPYLIIPSINFSAFGSFIITTLVLTFIFHFMYWLLQDTD